MPVKIYVGRDSNGQPQPPDWTHEHLDFINTTCKIWEKFHHLDPLYVVIANLQDPRADFVIISERGLGVMDFKKNDGCIVYSQGGHWYAEYPDGQRTIIKAGLERRRNPHQQVQEYADNIRQKLIKFRLYSHDWTICKMNTAVCFTHPTVSIEQCKHDQARLHRPRAPLWQEWETFDILQPDDVPMWADALRFRAEIEVMTKHGKRYDQHQLSKEQILGIAETVLNAIEYPQAYELMPANKPYAYLLFKQDEEGILPPFDLKREELTIGRGDSDFRIPERFDRVSRLHAKIRRSVNGIFLEDCSRYGTFVDGKQIKQIQLKPGQMISLGGVPDKKHVCVLEFTLEPPKFLGTASK